MIIKTVISVVLILMFAPLMFWLAVLLALFVIECFADIVRALRR